MSQRAVLVLAALTALLVGYVLVFERTSLTSKELDARKGRVLGSFVRERVDRLELQRGGKAVVLERKPLEDGTLGAWQMLEPERTEADQDAVDQVLGELEWLSARRTLENVSAADAKAFGLSAPRYRIWYRAGDERHLLAVGKPDVHGESVYVRTDDADSAYVVPKTLTEALDHSSGHFRGKDILGASIVIGWVRKVEIDHGDQKLVLSRGEGDAPWWFEVSDATQGPKGFADGGHIDGSLSALDDLKATRYLEPGPLLTGAQVALAKPEIAVRVSILPDQKREDQSPRLVELRVAGPCPDHADERLAQAGAKGPVVCVAADALKPFSADFSTFRRQGLLGVDPSQVEAFELSAGGRKLSLKRDGENWVGAAKENVDREAVELWLSQLAALRASEFLPLSPGPEQARMTLTLAGSKRESLVVRGALAKGSLPVQRGEEPLLSVFPAALLDLLRSGSPTFHQSDALGRPAAERVRPDRGACARLCARARAERGGVVGGWAGAAAFGRAAGPRVAEDTAQDACAVLRGGEAAPRAGLEHPTGEPLGVPQGGEPGRFFAAPRAGRRQPAWALRALRRRSCAGGGRAPARPAARAGGRPRRPRAGREPCRVGGRGRRRSLPRARPRALTGLSKRFAALRCKSKTPARRSGRSARTKSVLFSSSSWDPGPSSAARWWCVRGSRADRRSGRSPSWTRERSAPSP
ncbi:MAG: DUF4340 domain-containing protein [Myxococcales bacterium]